MAPFSSLTEGCIAKILSLTSPEDACRAAAVSREFKSAAESNTVWECFLPPEYAEKISASTNPSLVFTTKKELYFLLCDDGLFLENGRLFFRLSKSSGKKCYMVSARELQIAWEDVPEYWDWISFPESRFNEVAELLKVSWLDIRTTISSKWLSPNTDYAAYLVFKLRDDPIKLDIPAMASVRKTTEDEENVRTVYIVPPIDEGWRMRKQRMRMGQLARWREDGWMELELGEFFVPEGEDIFDVHCGIYEHKDQYWKRGLIVQGIEVKPKEEAL